MDNGARRYDPYGYIQSGCVAYTVGKKADKTNRSNITDVPIINKIPVGETIEWDDTWPETWMLIDGGDFCAETELTACIKEVSGDPGSGE